MSKLSSRLRPQPGSAVNIKDLAFVAQSALPVPAHLLPPPTRPPPDIPKSRKQSRTTSEEADADTAASGDKNGSANSNSVGGDRNTTRNEPRVSAACTDHDDGDGDVFGSCARTMFDDHSVLDGSAAVPPDPLTISDGDTARQSLRDTRDAYESVAALLAVESSPIFRYPLPPPPYAAPDYPIASRFHPVYAHQRVSGQVSRGFLQLSSESAEDVNIGSIVLSRARLKDVSVPSLARVPSISWRLYKKAEPGAEVWEVLREYLTNVSLKARGKTRALQLITGFVVSACLESTDVGIALLSEIVKRMRGTERSERDGSVFTLLINIAAHVSFVQRVAWPSVEQVTRRAFSAVVEDMYGRQDDDVMWKRALRCFLILLKSSDLPPSSDISTKCIVALALHARDLSHADIDHVLITNGLCKRLRPNIADMRTSIPLDKASLDEIGGTDVICSLFTDTTSISARLSLFEIIFDVAAFEAMSEMRNKEDDSVNDDVIAFRALLDAYDMADLLVHTFRAGPSHSFVMDTIRLLFLRPLTQQASDEIFGSSAINSSSPTHPAFPKSNSNMGAQQADADKSTMTQASASKYTLSLRTILTSIDKSLCLRILQQLENMAARQSIRLAQRENMRHPREWRLVYNSERYVQQYLYSRVSGHSVCLDDVLSLIHKVVASMTSDRASTRGVVRMAELIIEFFTMKLPFSRQKGYCDFTSCSDSVARLFLRGQVVVAHELIAQADSSIFTSLLVASRHHPPVKRVSECRQCLVEFLGASKERIHLLKEFTDDDEAAVAYRAREIISKFSDSPTHARSRPQSQSLSEDALSP